MGAPTGFITSVSFHRGGMERRLYSLRAVNQQSCVWILLFSHVLYAEKLLYNSKLIGHILKCILYVPNVGYSDDVWLKQFFF